MRLLLAAVVLSAMPAVGAAQSSTLAPDAAPPVSAIGLPLPQVGLPLPRIGLPLPQIGLPPATDRRPVPAADRSPRLRRDRNRTGHGKRGRSGPAIVFLPISSLHHPTAVDTATTPTGVPDGSADIDQAALATGRLRIDVPPDQRWQVYVDGYYVGMGDDFEGGWELEAGPHKVEIRAVGHESLVVDVKIPPRRTVTFEGELKPLPAELAPQPTPAPEEVPAATRSTYYVIPGCYVGNVPPQDARLPPTCDPSRAVTVK